MSRESITDGGQWLASVRFRAQSEAARPIAVRCSICADFEASTVEAGIEHRRRVHGIKPKQKFVPQKKVKTLDLSKQFHLVCEDGTVLAVAATLGSARVMKNKLADCDRILDTATGLPATERQGPDLTKQFRIVDRDGTVVGSSTSRSNARTLLMTTRRKSPGTEYRIQDVGGD